MVPADLDLLPLFAVPELRAPGYFLPRGTRGRSREAWALNGKKPEVPSDLLTRTPSTRLDALAFEVIMIRTARAFWEGQLPPAPVTAKEKAVRDEFRSYTVEEREAALDRVLTYTIGGVLFPLKEQLLMERAGRSRAAVKEAFEA
jgi:hypothetical protein